jgi:hypothetical protein
VYNSVERARGYKDALAKFNIPFNKDRMLKAGLTFKDGANAADMLIEKGISFDAIFAFTDTLAIGAMNRLRDFRTKLGKKVVRGEVIGGVGSTGKSTGPHLHYEVHVKGKVVNPVNYYFMDLSAEDYDRMIQIAANHGKVLD